MNVAAIALALSFFCLLLLASFPSFKLRWSQLSISHVLIVLGPQSGPGPTALTRVTWKLTRKTDSDTPVFLPFTQQVFESQVCIRKTLESEQ